MHDDRGGERLDGERNSGLAKQPVGGFLTPQRLRWITITLFALAVLASGLFVSGSSSAAGH